MGFITSQYPGIHDIGRAKSFTRAQPRPLRTEYLEAYGRVVVLRTHLAFDLLHPHLQVQAGDQGLHFVGFQRAVPVRVEAVEDGA